jgi:hypothetical protein
LRASAGRGVARVQQELCIVQIALGMALLAIAGLLAHSLWQLSTVDPGFDVEHVVGFNMSVPNDQAVGDRVRFYQNALDEIRTIPGVERAGLISFLPPETRAGVFMGLAIDGVPPAERGAPPRYQIWGNLGDAYRWAPGKREQAGCRRGGRREGIRTSCCRKTEDCDQIGRRARVHGCTGAAIVVPHGARLPSRPV